MNRPAANRLHRASLEARRLGAARLVTRVMIPAVVLVALVACEPAELPPVVQLSDSAGVSIALIDFERASTMEVDQVPAWIVGDADDPRGGGPLHLIADVHLSPDSMLYITESSTQSILVRHLGSGEASRFGGAGDGPGEFRGIASLHPVRGGAVGVFDRERHRFVEFGRDGERLSDVELPPAVSLGGWQEFYRSGDGTSFLLTTSALPSPREPLGEYRVRSPLLRLASGIDTLTWVQGATVFHGQFVGGVFHGAEPVATAGPSGLWLGDTAEPELRHWKAASGAVDRIVRWKTGDRALTNDYKRAFVDRMFADEGVDDPATRRAFEGMLWWAELVPAFGKIIVSSDGTLWIGSEFPPRERRIPRLWVAVDLEGARAFRLRVPEGFRLMRVVDDIMIGVHTNELGVETIRGHRFGEADAMALAAVLAHARAVIPEGVIQLSPSPDTVIPDVEALLGPAARIAGFSHGPIDDAVARNSAGIYCNMIEPFRGVVHVHAFEREEPGKVRVLLQMLLLETDRCRGYDQGDEVTVERSETDQRWRIANIVRSWES